MISIRLKKDESIEHALKRFKRKCQQAGLHKSIRKSRHYMKPSERKKLARIAARRRHRKRQMTDRRRR